MARNYSPARSTACRSACSVIRKCSPAMAAALSGSLFVIASTSARCCGSAMSRSAEGERFVRDTQAHLCQQLLYQVRQRRVVRGRRDAAVQLHVGGPGGRAVGRFLVPPQRAQDRRVVLQCVALGGRPRDQRLDEPPQVEQLLELVPVLSEQVAHGPGRPFAPVLPHERPAGATTPDLHVPGLAQVRQRRPHRHAADGQHVRQVPFRGQPLSGRVVADGDRGDQPVRDGFGRGHRLHGHRQLALFRHPHIVNST